MRRFHGDAIAAGYRSNGEPGERPRYHAGYYSAYVLDPDGNNIEVVDHHYRDIEALRDASDPAAHGRQVRRAPHDAARPPSASSMQPSPGVST